MFRILGYTSIRRLYRYCLDQ